MQSSLAVTERQEHRRDGSRVHHGRRRTVTHTFSDWERNLTLGPISFPVKWSGQGGIAERISMKICNDHVMDIPGSWRWWKKAHWFRWTMTHVRSHLEPLTGVGGRVRRAASLRKARTFCSSAEGLQDWVLSIRNTFKAGWEGFWSEWAACVLLQLAREEWRLLCPAPLWDGQSVPDSTTAVQSFSWMKEAHI